MWVYACRYGRLASSDFAPKAMNVQSARIMLIPATAIVSILLSFIALKAALLSWALVPALFFVQARYFPVPNELVDTTDDPGCKP